MRIHSASLTAIALFFNLSPFAFSQSWPSEIVDSMGSVGKFSSLAIDDQGNPHIAYQDITNLTLKYAFFDSTNWHTEVADATYGAGFQVSLALDSLGRPHISYNEEAADDLRYAWFDGSAWQVEVVDNSRNTGEYTSIALDSQDRPRISFIHRGPTRLQYAEYNGVTWVIHDVADVSSTNPTSLVLDSMERPHIAFSHSNDVKYATYDGASWTVNTVVPQASALEIVRDPSGALLILFSAGSSLMQAEYDGVSWSVSPIDESGDAGAASIAISPSGRRHVVFSTRDSIEHAVFDDGEWQRKEVLQTTGYNADLSLALRQDGSPYLSFHPTEQDLRVAYCQENGTWTEYGAGWPGTNGVPALTPQENPILGQTLTLDAENSLGQSTTAILLLGRQRAFVPSPWDGTILVGPFVPSSLKRVFSLSPGLNPIPFQIPDDIQLLGHTLTLQMIQADPGASKGFSFSRGVELVIGDC